MAAIVHLIGFPGAGKFTIAKEMERIAADRGDRMVVVDNHHINNTIFAMLDVDGVKAVPPSAWARIAEVREAVLRTIAELSPPAWSFVFTNVLFADDAGDERHVELLAELAVARGSVFVPVRVTCDVEELVRRVVKPARRERMKWTDGEAVRALAERRELVTPTSPLTLELDVTSLPAEDAAAEILDHVANGAAR